MQKLRFFFLFLFSPLLLLAQERTKIVLDRSESVRVDVKNNKSYVKKPIFRHDNATLTCDSAIFYSSLNYFEAFSKVHINQADTVNIYSDLLNYDGNAKMAHLINNVRMVDPSSTLTTNILDYDMARKIGTYVDGGKIINKDKDVTIKSKRGWYFGFTNDAYFKYDVDVVTPQVRITADTLRYNTVSNWALFDGPTNIKGKDDKLYTEKGAYNTKEDNAIFGKNNLYTQGSKSLKGDSLYYYGKKGYGRAVKNITFLDTEDKLLLRGHLGEYYKIDERVVVTENAYVGMGTADSVLVNEKKIPDSLWIGADTLQAQMVLQKTLKLIPSPVILKDNEIGTETAAEKKEKEDARAAAKAEQNAAVTPPKASAATKPDKKKEREDKKNKKNASQAAELKLKIDSVPKPPDSLGLKITIDSVKMDSLKKVALKKDSAIVLQKKADVKDTVKTANKIAPKTAAVTKTDSAAKAFNPKAIALKPAAKDSLPFNPADTVRTRSIKAFHNVRVFKTNLQAKSDSLFYTAADSTLRWYQNPIIWSESSQQTGDTIYIQFKNKKVNNLQVMGNGFMVNTEGDSTKFNQVKGKLMTGFFTEGELRTMYVDKNAESIYFTKDNKGAYDKMNQTVSGRIKFNFVDKELDNMLLVNQNEGAYYSINELPKETTLTGFIWKPELRPISKADIIKGLPSAKKPTKPVAKSKVSPKTTAKPTTGAKPTTPGKKPIIDPKQATKKEVIPPKPIDKAKVDSVKKVDTVKLDTTKVKVPIKN